MVCADDGWTGRTIATSPLDTHVMVLFTELTDNESRRSINVLNIHLQSIGGEDKVKGSGDLLRRSN